MIINKIEGKEVLVTGGTGTLGKELVKQLIRFHNPKGIRIYSRDEFKQWQLQNYLKEIDCPIPVSFLIGDIRDRDRMMRALKGVDIVFHTAAMKQVPACEYNPIEALMTNTIGAKNLLEAAIDNNVEIVMNVSTDKAVYPVNFYGMTKGAAEKLLIHGNVYSPGKTKFACCRYGNVINSRGSIIPLFKEQAKTGIITVTDSRMTRFFIPIETVARFIIERIGETEGGEIFVPRMKSSTIVNIAAVVAPGCSIKEIGIRQGEKLHECLITEEESTRTVLEPSYFVINPPWTDALPTGSFSYSSDKNVHWLTQEEIEMYAGEV